MGTILEFRASVIPLPGIAVFLFLPLLHVHIFALLPDGYDGA